MATVSSRANGLSFFKERVEFTAPLSTAALTVDRTYANKIVQLDLSSNDVALTLPGYLLHMGLAFEILITASSPAYALSLTSSDASSIFAVLNLSNTVSSGVTTVTLPGPTVGSRLKVFSSGGHWHVEGSAAANENVTGGTTVAATAPVSNYYVSSTGTITLPAPSASNTGNQVNIIRTVDGGSLVVSSGDALAIKFYCSDDTKNITADATVTSPQIGDRVDLMSDGTNWIGTGYVSVAASAVA